MRTHWMLSVGAALVLLGVIGCGPQVETKDLGTLIYVLPEIPQGMTPYVLPGSPPPEDGTTEMAVPQDLPSPP